MAIIKDRHFYKNFFGLFGVVALQGIIVFSVNLADNIMLGNYSENAMSGVSLANQVQFLLQMFVGGVSGGMSVLTSQYWGRKELEPIKRVFAAALVFAAGLSFILSVIVIAFPESVLGILSDKTDIVHEGAVYLRIMGFSYVVFALSNLLVAVMRSVESVKIGFFSSLAALFVNIGLNYLLIFGKFGAPELGAAGAAYATVAARIAETVVVVIYCLCIDKKLHIKLRDFFLVKKDYLCDFIRTGVPMLLSSTFWGIAMCVQTSIMGNLSVEVYGSSAGAAIGANAIATPIFQIASVLYAASSTASSVLIGKTVGENDYERVKSYAKKLQFVFLGVGLLSSGIMLAFYPLVPYLYSEQSPETLKLARTFILILSVTVIGSAYEAPCLGGIVAGGGSTRFVLFNDLIFMWGIVLPLSFLSAYVFKFPIPITFFLLKSDQVTKCVVAVIKVNRFHWIKKVTR